MITLIKDKIQGKLPSGSRRSSRWNELRAEFLKEHPTCAVCNGKTYLEVHHIIPFFKAPELELDPANLIVLCESKKKGINCHLFFGHHGNYKYANEDVRTDAAHWNTKLRDTR
jgi:5-methylcytosine-specific restriction endonuclease McrA